RAGTLEEQAAGPMLNPLEMNNASKLRVVEKVRQSPYASAFRDLYGPNALADVDTAFANATRAVAAYERTPELAPFSSRYDRYLAGTGTLTPEERRGAGHIEGPPAPQHASRPPRPPPPPRRRPPAP